MEGPHPLIGADHALNLGKGPVTPGYRTGDKRLYRLYAPGIEKNTLSRSVGR